MNGTAASAPSAAGVDLLRLAVCAREIAQTGTQLAALGWTPATSGNFSMRLGDAHAAITISGRNKGALSPDDVMVIDLEGRAIGTTASPSAETALHTQIYRRFPDAGAILHTHSRTQTVASRLFANKGMVTLAGYELLKAFPGYARHDLRLDIPVFPNTQEMPELVMRIDNWLDSGKALHAYLIDGHGIYTWGRDMSETRRHLEALEFMLGCELDLRRLGGLA